MGGRVYHKNTLMAKGGSQTVKPSFHRLAQQTEEFACRIGMTLTGPLHSPHREFASFQHITHNNLHQKNSHIANPSKSMESHGLPFFFVPGIRRIYRKGKTTRTPLASHLGSTWSTHLIVGLHRNGLGNFGEVGASRIFEVKQCDFCWLSLIYTVYVYMYIGIYIQ